MSLDNILNQVLSMKAPRYSHCDTFSVVKLGVQIDSLTNVMGRKADDIAYILSGRGNRADVDKLESTLISLLPDDMSLLKKALKKLTDIDDKTHAIRKSYYLGLLHTVIYKKIESINHPELQFEANPNIVLLLDLNDLCADFLKSIKNTITKKLIEARLYVSLEEYCQKNATLVPSPEEKARLQKQYYEQLEQTIHDYAERNPTFHALHQQHKEVYHLQNKLFDTRYSLNERSFVFESRLKMNLPLITRNFTPDPALTVFLKGLIVLLAFVVTIPLLGVGGYLAYKGLFKIQGQDFIDKVAKIKQQHEPQPVELSNFSESYQKLTP